MDGDYIDTLKVKTASDGFEVGFILPTPLMRRLVECGLVAEGLNAPAGEQDVYYPTRPEYASVLMTLLGALDLAKLRLTPHLEAQRGQPPALGCVRCGSRLDKHRRCTDVTCEFHDHDQDCAWGWLGHPEMEWKVEEARHTALGDACECKSYEEGT